MSLPSRRPAANDADPVDVGAQMDQLTQRIQAARQKLAAAKKTQKPASDEAAEASSPTTASENTGRELAMSAHQKLTHRLQALRNAQVSSPNAKGEQMEDWIFSSVSSSVVPGQLSSIAPAHSPASEPAPSTPVPNHASWTGWFSESEPPKRDWGELI